MAPEMRPLPKFSLETGPAAGDSGTSWNTPFAAAVSGLPAFYTVQLSGQHLTVDHAQKLAEAIDALRTEPQLRLTALHLGDNLLGPAGSVLVARAALASSCQPRCAAELWPNRPTLSILELAWNRVLAEGAVRLGSAMMQARRGLQALDLDCNDIEDDGAVALAGALRDMPELKRLRLGGNRINARGGKALAEALGGGRLESLDLSRNYIGKQGAAAFAEVLGESGTAGQNSCLLYLSLAVNRIVDEGAGSLASALKTNTRLDTLDIAANRITDLGATEMITALSSTSSVSSSALRCLNLKYNRLTDAAVDGVADMASRGRNTQLQMVELVGNDEVTAPAVARMTTALRKNCRSLALYDPFEAALEMCLAGSYSMDLSDLAVGGERTERLASALSGPRARVQDFCVSNAGVGDTDAHKMCMALAKRVQHLRSLDLSWNRINGDVAEGIGAVASLLRDGSSALEQLNLECNNLRDQGLPYLSDALVAHAQQDIAEGKAQFQLHALRSLKLAGNSIGAAGAGHLVVALLHPGVRLLELDLSRNQLGPKGAAALAKALRHPQLSLQRLYLDVNRLRDAGAQVLGEALLQAAQSAGGSEEGIALHLASNLIGDSGLAALAEALGAGDRIAGLHLELNKISGQGAEMLASAVRLRRRRHPRNPNSKVCLKHLVKLTRHEEISDPIFEPLREALEEDDEDANNPALSPRASKRRRQCCC
eukprot:TRINITY_DN45848_c0_g1_i2.p1 TRINITY_DN45848_c0_g1~~TRINITY_DN45848_c0_g1_i2.p1  ORF type:complete len:713 (+),score=118.99 TRINITY_DN45848_c0_g1_i2:75-2213(+)